MISLFVQTFKSSVKNSLCMLFQLRIHNIEYYMIIIDSHFPVTIAWGSGMAQAMKSLHMTAEKETVQYN